MNKDMENLPTPEPGELSYNSYLKIPELLSLQKPLSKPEHHDEVLFIVIHQTYELWFRLILHEMESSISSMEKKEILKSRSFINRVVEILKILVPQIHILETMMPVEFLHFRKNLMPASGFQSSQFREVEFLAGVKDKSYLRFFEHEKGIKEKLESRLNQNDLRTAYYDLLKSLNYKIPENTGIENLSKNPEDADQLIKTLAQIYEHPEKNLPLYLLTETLMDFDEYLSLWRNHHVKVVERILGFKPGTGGSSGVMYLRKTTEKQAFPYLWQVRTAITDGNP
jgi:tryptophan 2,3-dioxygenase